MFLILILWRSVNQHITHCDNPNGNIIHRELTYREEIQRTIEESPDEISHVFNRKENRPVIRPINFTSGGKKNHGKTRIRNILPLWKKTKSTTKWPNMLNN